MSTHPAIKHGIYSIRDLQSHYERTSPNGHWFAKETMGFWKSKLSEHLWYPNEREVIFISSERFSGERRHYTIRRYNTELGGIETVSKFEEFRTLNAAKIAATRIAAEG